MLPLVAMVAVMITLPWRPGAASAASAPGARNVNLKALLDPNLNAWEVREPSRWHNGTASEPPFLCKAGKCERVRTGHNQTGLPWRLEDLRHAVLISHADQFGSVSIYEGGSI